MTTIGKRTPSDPGVVTGGSRDPRLIVCVAAGVSAVLGLVVYLAWPDSSATVGDTAVTSLALPVALVVALGGTATASAVLNRSAWRVVDIVVASVLGVAGGLLFWAWNTFVWTSVSNALAFLPPASAILVGVWLLPGVLGGLVIRKPGAAVYTEVVAATLSALLGNQWGFSTVWYGLVEGLGAEVVLALLLYRRFGLVAAVGSGMGAGVAVGLLDTVIWYPAFSPAYKLVYIALAVVSGAVIAGAGGWALTRRLAATGALAPLASGRDARRV